MKVKKTTLKNGLRILTVPMKGNPTVTVMTLVEAGSKYETKDSNGISHFLEHMCFKGTEKRPNYSDIGKELDGIGASFNAFTSQEYTGYYAKADSKHTDKILDIISDMYLNPIFDEKEIEKEKGVIIQEISMYEDMPKYHVQDMFLELLYGNQPAGWNIAGTRENVKNFNREDFVNYRKDHYVASATTVIVAGDFNEKKMINDISVVFGNMSSDLKKGKSVVIERQSHPNLSLKTKDTDQTHLVFGYRAFNLFDKRMPVLAVASMILGGSMSSRLFRKLRDEMGVAYYVRTEVDSFTDHGVFAVSAGIDKDRVEEIIKVIKSEFVKMTNELVPKDELRKAKDCIIGRMKLGLESSDDLANYYGFQELLKKSLETPEEKSVKIEKVTAKDIMKVMKEIVNDEKLNLAIIGKVKEESILKRAIS